LYVWWQRTFLHPSLVAFDAPSREECVADRSRSNIPQQALTLLNDPSYVEAFRALAVRTLQTDSAAVPDRIRFLWQQALQRDPTDGELQTVQALLEHQLASYETGEVDPRKLLAVGQAPVPESLSPAELAAWTHVARVVLNLHESITRN
jgi:hypothetical protein